MHATEQLNTALTGRYTIERRVGEGGMATVYLARDVRHNRRVALKVLKADLGAVVGVDRFLSEIEVTAKLQHPNLLPLFDSGAADGLLFYVMPYVEGESLRARLDRERQLPVEEAVRLATAIAGALDYAHRQGVIHRDLKPENVLLQEGQPLVADFGIALAVSNAGGARITETGLSLGTPQYMSPEQATGDRVIDGRTDIYSLGALTYEMLTGEPPHIGTTSQAIIARVLTERPRSIRSSRPSVPEPVEAMVERALEKLPADRFATAREFAEGLSGVRPMVRTHGTSSGPSGATAAGASRGSWPLMLVGAALVSAALTGLLTWALMRARTPVLESPSRFAVVLPSTLLLRTEAYHRSFTVSPDGRSIVYASNGGQLVLRTLDRPDLQPLLGIRTRSIAPYFSPDSRSIAFVDGGDLKRVAITGGPITTVGQSLGAISDGYWSDDGTIIFSTEFMGLRSLPDAGGEVTTLTSLDPAQHEIFHSSPWALPERRGILFTNWARVGDVEPQIAVLDLRTGRRKTLLRGGLAPAYVHTGHLLYQASGTLYVVPFDLERLEVTGEPVRQDLSVSANEHLGLVSPAFALSRTGTLVIAPGKAEPRQLVWVDRQGRETALNTPPRMYEVIRLSPDATRAAITMADDKDVWVWDFARDALTRLTFGGSVGWVPVWTPDGQQILYASNRAGPYNLYRRNADGSGAEERLTTSINAQVPNSVTPDGTILGAEAQATTGWDVVKFAASPRGPSSGSVAPIALFRSDEVVATPHEEYAANISPDGRFFAFQGHESGRPEIYVRPYPSINLGRWQVSTEGGIAPVWARSGRELFFLDGSNRLMAAPVQTADGRFTQGKAARVLDTAYWGIFYSYDVSPDGQRFLMIKRSGTPNQDAAASSSIDVILNWADGLKARVPAR